MPKLQFLHLSSQTGKFFRNSEFYNVHVSGFRPGVRDHELNNRETLAIAIDNESVSFPFSSAAPFRLSKEWLEHGQCGHTCSGGHATRSPRGASTYPAGTTAARRQHISTNVDTACEVAATSPISLW